MTRRAFGSGLGIAGIGGSLFAARWYNIGARPDEERILSAPDAHRAAMAGALILIDIRRPDEWQRTGVGEGARPLDMRRTDFTEALLAQASTHDHPIALICARGVRSRGLAARLKSAGFTNVLDVSEGMSGSGAGPGWIKRGLPVVVWHEG